MKALLSLFALFTFASVVAASDFPRLSEIDGVKLVEYDEPFLLVVVRSPSRLDVVDEQVRVTIERGEEPEVGELGKAVRLRVVTERQYARLQREKEMVREADTAAELLELVEACRFASVYHLDWSQIDPVVSRDRFVKRYFPPSAAELELEIGTVRGFVDRLRGKKRRPDRLVYLSMPSVGSLVYPVFGDDIRILGAAIPFSDFSAGLPKPQAD